MGATWDFVTWIVAIAMMPAAGFSYDWWRKRRETSTGRHAAGPETAALPLAERAAFRAARAIIPPPPLTAATVHHSAARRRY